MQTPTSSSAVASTPMAPQRGRRRRHDPFYDEVRPYVSDSDLDTPVPARRQLFESE
jgi:hypothetical protein